MYQIEIEACERRDFMDFETEEFESIPLPDQVPNHTTTSTRSPKQTPSQPLQKNIDFIEDVSSHIDSSIGSSKSRTVQTLMNQNQDLSSRLSVALKKNIELEQRLEESEDHFRHLKNKFESSAEQNQLLKDKINHFEGQISQLLNENQTQDLKFSELYNAYQEKIEYIKKLSYRLHRFLKYRTHIRGYIRPFINRLKIEGQEYKSYYIKASEKIQEQEILIQNLKQRVQEAIEHIQKQAQTFEQDQAELVSYHEERYQAVCQENEKLSQQYTEKAELSLELNKEVEALKEQEVELTNKAIYFERIYTDLKAEHDLLKSKSETTQAQDSNRIKQLEGHTQQLSEKLNETIQYAQNLYNDHNALNDQYASLQILFQENLNKNEDYKKRLLSLEQMNKELSQSLLENRKKNETLEEKLSKTEDDFKRKLESFQHRFQKPTDLARAIPAVGQKELLNKIQNLLSEIQTGKQDTHAETISNELISEHGDIGQSTTPTNSSES